MSRAQSVARAWLLRVARRPPGQLSQFRQEVEGKKFRNPDTGNEVLFVSLPKAEQAKIFAEWRRRQRGDEPRREKTRGLLKVDKQRARDKAREMADSVLSIKFREPDEKLYYQRGVDLKFPHEVGVIKVDHVRWPGMRVPVKVEIGEPSGEEWTVDRKFVIGGRAQTRKRGIDDPGFPLEVAVKLDRNVTPKQLHENRDRLEREIYDVLIHELTHAQDVLPTERRQRERAKRDRDKPEGERYYNKPEEVRAFKQQVVDELEHELERLYEGEDEPDWIGADAESVQNLLGKSRTWERVRKHLTPQNRRKFLETAASVVRRFKEERGGKVARRVATAWVRRAISEKYVRPFKKVDTDDLPFDHLFEGRRRMAIDPEDYGGLGASEPDGAEELEKFLRDNGALGDAERVDWQRGYVVDGAGKTKSKVGKTFQKAVRKFVGDDREFHESMTKVRRGLAKGESPIQRTLGMGRDNVQALTGMGHLLVEDFPTSEIWNEIERFGVPSPGSWKRIKEVADRFAELSPDERVAKMQEHEEEYEDAEASEDYRKQYWAARGLFQTHNKAKRGDEADWLMKHFRGWAERTDDFYESDDAQPLRRMHELGAKMDPARLEELRNLQEVEKKQQGYDLWRSIRGEDLAVVVSRDPVDVLRMSDYPKAVQAIQSCHSEGGSEFQCAIEEAEEGGMIAYVVKKSDVEGRDLDEGELFADPGRGVEGIKPYARLRLRRFESDAEGGLEVAVPETTTYGADFPDLVKAVTDWAREAQPEFVSGDAGYSKRPRDWRLTGGTYQDSESSELFDNFFDRDEDDRYGGGPTEDEYDPYGEGYTLEDSPYYDPDREDDDEGEAEVAEKSVHPWRATDRMTDFWDWMTEKHPRIRNPNPRGTKEYISPATLKGYARGAASYSRNARETVNRYLGRYRQERSEYAEARARGDVRAASVVAAWLRRLVAGDRDGAFEEWVEGRRFKNPATGNRVLFKSLPPAEQAKIRARWKDGGGEDARPGRVRAPLFHTTSHASLEAIAEHGLRPRAGGGTFEHGGYAEHSQGKVFLSDNPRAARAWQEKVFQQLEDRHGDEDEEVGRRVPVMLRVKSRKTRRDEAGDRDVPGSRYVGKAVPPEDIEFWHPGKKRWAPVAEWEDVAADLAVSREDGDTYVDDEAFMPGDEDAYDRDDAELARREKDDREREARRRREEQAEREREERESREREYLEPAKRREWIDRIKERGAKSPIPALSTPPGVFPPMWQKRLKVDEKGVPLPDHPLEE